MLNHYEIVKYQFVIFRKLLHIAYRYFPKYGFCYRLNPKCKLSN